MPGPITHISLAMSLMDSAPHFKQESLRRPQDTSDYLLGCIMPDLRLLLRDSCDIERDDTHFGSDPINFISKLETIHDDSLALTQFPFVIGYSTHLVVDRIWTDLVYDCIVKDREISSNSVLNPRFTMVMDEVARKSMPIKSGNEIALCLQQGQDRGLMAAILVDKCDSVIVNARKLDWQDRVAAAIKYNPSHLGLSLTYEDEHLIEHVDDYPDLFRSISSLLAELHVYMIQVFASELENPIVFPNGAQNDSPLWCNISKHLISNNSHAGVHSKVSFAAQKVLTYLMEIA
jgi:hypothetical protein